MFAGLLCDLAVASMTSVMVAEGMCEIPVADLLLLLALPTTASMILQPVLSNLEASGPTYPEAQVEMDIISQFHGILQHHKARVERVCLEHSYPEVSLTVHGSF